MSRSEFMGAVRHLVSEYKERGANFFELKDTQNVLLELLSKYRSGLFGEREMIEKDINFLLEEGANINAMDKDGSALIVAVKRGYKNIVKLLLDKGADVSLRDEDGATVLNILAQSHLFSPQEKIKIISHILDKDPTLANVQDNEGRTALMSAISPLFKLDVVKAILEKTTDINLQNNKGETALMIACKSGYSEAVRVLLEKGANPNIADNNSHYPLACVYKLAIDDEVGRMAMNMSNGYDPRNLTKEQRSSELRAYPKELIEKMRQLNSSYRSGDGLEKLKRDARNLISDYEMEKMVSLLLQYGADMSLRNKDGATAIMTADKNNNGKLVEKLIKFGAKEIQLGQNKELYFTDHGDFRNISCEASGNKWSEFVQFLVESVANAKLNKYPYAKLNEDGSISFFTESGIDGKYASRDYIAKQLEYVADKLDINTQHGRKVLEFNTHADSGLGEYRFNVAPKDLDAILKLNPKYRGYRNDGNILNLASEPKVKEGSIMLLPLFALDDKFENSIIRSAGCQLFEIPSLQLMRLLPNYETEILPRHEKEGFRFHWIPKEVQEGLLIDRVELTEILKAIFARNKISADGFEHDAGAEYLSVSDASQLNSVKIVEMDDVAKDFYTMYGNASQEEYASCHSLEVRTSDFLEEIGNCLNKKLEVCKKDPSKAQDLDKINKAMKNLEKMIEVESKRCSGDLKSAASPNTQFSLKGMRALENAGLERS